MTGDVLIGLWKVAHNPLDAAIKVLTHGKVGHAGFIRGNGKIVENFYPHVHERDFENGERERVKLFRIDGQTPADNARLERWIDYELNFPPPYSIVDLFRYAANLPPKQGQGCFCSQWVLRGLRCCVAQHKQPLARLEYQDFASPRDLLVSPRLIPIDQ